MLAVLSDIHGNLPALEAVLEDAKARGCTRFLSLGDVVGYYAQPGQCIDVLRELGVPNILGNHDSYITLDQTCQRSKLVAAIISYQKTQLGAAQVDWLKGSIDAHSEGDSLFLHGGPDDHRDQYLYEVSPRTIPRGYRWLFSGHTHVQALIDFGTCGYCNPGAVGQPRDGDCRAAYATVGAAGITLRRVPYDIDRTVRAMAAAGFEAHSYENLYRGTQIGGRIDSVTIANEDAKPNGESGRAV